VVQVGDSRRLAKLLGISKRGNVYLRKILIHGARAAVLRIKRDRAPNGAWLDALDSRAPKNVVVVAMANKLARIAWLYSPAETNTDPSPHSGAEKRLHLGSVRSYFPEPRRRLEVSPPKSAQEQQGPKNSHNGVSAA
jgi:hypothetical protein